ncbi:hypothetical protein PINS_up009109 [Pythium insidiosum]|nr:hypothetical protein PINS_up009109 [Pythium insidiosum]
MILKQALFDWDNMTTGGCDEYVALRDALLARIARQQPPRTRADQRIGLTLSLEPRELQVSDAQVYASHVDQLFRAISTSNARQTTGFYVRQVTCDGFMDICKVPREVTQLLLTTVLSHAVPVALDPHYYTTPFNVSTLTEACAHGSKASLGYLTRMTLELDPEALQDEAIVNSFCELLSTQCCRLERLTVVGSACTDSEAQRSLELLSAALFAPQRLQFLDLSKLSLQDPDKANHVTTCRDSSDSSRCAALRTLWLSDDANAREQMLIAKIGSNLSEISLSASHQSSYRSYHIKMLETIARCCPRLTQLFVSDFAFDEAFVQTLASASEAGAFSCLRELSIDAEYGVNVAACVRLMHLLSDPRQRLAQTLEDLMVYASKETLSVMRQATDLMLRCNARLQCVEITHCDDDESDDGDNDDGDSNAAEDSTNQREIVEEYIPSDAVRLMLDEMAVKATGKTAALKNVASPGVVLLPSMRHRIAFLSVLAERDVSLPPPVAAMVMLMAGRSPCVQQTSDVAGFRYDTFIRTASAQ